MAGGPVLRGAAIGRETGRSNEARWQVSPAHAYPGWPRGRAPGPGPRALI